MNPLRDRVAERAMNRCEYCLVPDGTNEVRFLTDHIIAVQHRGQTTMENLALACHRCNLYKGPNVAGVDPVTNALTRLFNPRSDRWDEHFRKVGEQISPRTDIGRVTLYVLQMNDPLRLAQRAALIAEGRW